MHQKCPRDGADALGGRRRGAQPGGDASRACGSRIRSLGWPAAALKLFLKRSSERSSEISRARRSATIRGALTGFRDSAYRELGPTDEKIF